MSIDRLAHGLSEYALESFDAGPDPYALSGVLFADNFDLVSELGHAAPSPPEPPPVEVILSDDDVRAARQDGYADGVRAGRMDADSSARMAHEIAANALTNALVHATDAACTAAGEAATILGQTILEAVALLLPEMCARHGAAEAAALVAALDTMLAPSTQLVIRAHPATLAGLTTITPRSGTVVHRISHVPDDDLSPGDVTVEWQGGTARRSVDSLLSQLRQVLNPPLATSVAPPHQALAAAPAPGPSLVKDFSDG